MFFFSNRHLYYFLKVFCLYYTDYQAKMGAAIGANNYKMPYSFLEIFNVFIKTLALLLY
jgi:hypothetical protein